MMTVSEACDFASQYAADHKGHGEEWNRLFMEGLGLVGYRLEAIDDDAQRPTDTIDAPAPAGFDQPPPRKPGLVTSSGYPYPSIIVLA